MGGPGSGPRRPGGKRTTVEASHGFGVRDLRRLGLLAPGAHVGDLTLRRLADDRPGLTVLYTALIGDGGGVVYLDYAVAGILLADAVRIATTPCHFGGRRWHLLCPRRGCGRRVEALYFGLWFFACRRCHGLTYDSTQSRDRRVESYFRGGFDEAAFAAIPKKPGTLRLRWKILDRERRRLARQWWRLHRPAG